MRGNRAGFRAKMFLDGPSHSGFPGTFPFAAGRSLLRSGNRISEDYLGQAILVRGIGVRNIGFGLT